METTKPDIINIHDVEHLIDLFYQKMMQNPEVTHFFDATDWAHHKPVMVRFWENMLFFTGSYFGNPMEVHQKIHQVKPFTAAHFQIWQQSFHASVDELFAGEKADLAKSRASSIATVMQIKILGA